MRVWADPFSLATTQGVEVSFLSSGYLDVSVPQLASSHPMDSGTGTAALPAVSFLIRRSRDQRMVSSSPGLIAAAHVLLRLLVPRHPPCALVLLIRRTPVLWMSLWSFQGPRGLAPNPRTPARGRSLKTQQRTNAEVDVVPGEPTGPTAGGLERPCHQGVRRPPEYKSSGIPRKEVIQPQLPLRLPCYDFTPIIDPTFDSSLPCGLGHRLRVLPTFVV